MTALDVRDPAALEAALEALPLGEWVEVETVGEVFRLVRMPGGWHLPGDLTVASGDVVDGHPARVVLLGNLFGEDPGDLTGRQPTTDTDSEALEYLWDEDPDEAREMEGRRHRREK